MVLFDYLNSCPRQTEHIRLPIAFENFYLSRSGEKAAFSPILNAFFNRSICNLNSSNKFQSRSFIDKPNAFSTVKCLDHDFFLA